jgi:hypothetical protein
MSNSEIGLLTYDELEAFYLDDDTPTFENVADAETDGEAYKIAEDRAKSAHLCYRVEDLHHVVYRIRNSL